MFRYLSASLLFLMPFLSVAQGENFVESASIIANSIEIDAEGNLTAKGNVEVHYKENILKAKEIYYARSSDELSAKGPLSLIDHTGNETKAGDAIFKSEFQEAILLATRVILKNQLEISADELKYAINDKSVFSRVSATSCKTCENEKPFWIIKAKKVSHNQKLKTIYFYDASFEILGVPAFYTPYISIPDPSAKRAVGFLAPEFLSNSRLDFGVKLPFFIPLDVNKDITFTPFITPQTNTIETRYRQAFSRGNLVVDSSLTRDDLDDKQFRGYLSINGEFDLENGYNLNYEIERVSDSAYLGDYGYSARNELSSGLNYSKVKSDRLFETSLGVIQSLYKEDKDNLTLTTNNYYDRIIDQNIIPGSVSFNSELVGSWRKGSEDIIGRDVARFANQLVWNKSTISKLGLELGTGIVLNQDVFLAVDDSRLNDLEILNSIGTNIFIRMPFLSNTEKATHMLEPLAQVAWGERKKAIVYIDESENTEFDMGNLLAISRYSASDQFETGFHGAYGVRYNFNSKKNITGGFSLGQVLRLNEDLGFTSSSGLENKQSDIFLAAELSLAKNSYVSFQGLLSNKFEAKKTDFNAGFDYETIYLDTKYSFLQSDVEENRLNQVEEWTIDTGYKLNDNWKLKSNLRYDQSESHLALLGAGLAYENQCVLLNLEMDRRYSLEGTSPPTTNFSFAISLKGFSTGPVNAIQSKNCK